MSKVLITFIGSHDLNRTRETNGTGPIEQLINYLKPTKTYIFLTSEYQEEFENNKLEDFYNSITDGEVTILPTDIENPTDCEEIANKISCYIDEINSDIVNNKWQGFVNLTSGTPAIISVLSLFVITGQLNRSFGMYAPNPKFDNKVKMTALDFYKNSFTFKTLKDMINLMDYVAIDEFLTKNKNIFPKLESNEEFKNIVKFAKYRATCNYEKAKELHDKHEYLQTFKYNLPKNLYEKSLELYMSALISERNADDFQSVLKSGIVRENLNTFVVRQLLKTNAMDIIEDRPKKEGGTTVPYFKEENLKYYPDLIAFIEENLNKSLSMNKSFDTSREINDFTINLIFDYFLKYKSNKFLEDISKEFYKIEKLKAERNKVAHTINPPQYRPEWLKSIEKILNLIADNFNFEKPNFAVYQEINKRLLIILKDTLNG